MKNLSTSKKLFLVLVFSIFMAFFASCTKEELVNNTDLQNETWLPDNQIPQQSIGKFVPNEILVKFKSEFSENERSQAFARIGGSVTEKVVTKTMQRFGDNEGFYIISTPLDVWDAISKMKGAEIEYAEPNYIYYHGAVSNDPYYTNGLLWGMYGDATTPANQFGSQSGEAWAVNKIGSSSVHIGVIDEGAMFNHEDLVGNSWTNPFDPIDGIDNDGNGYKDDVRGWDFDGDNNTVFDGVDDDHGTHVSGTIGAKGGNGKGVAGVNWNVTLIYVKFLGRNGGTTANAIKAVDYITDLKTRHGLNIPATNNSWGGGGFSQLLKNAIDRANAQNILFVAAAGNNSSDNDATISYPSGYTSDNIIAVASITSTGLLSSFSNYGVTTVDLGAPGSGINSTLPKRSGNTIISSYGSYSGTSMATPHVTGAVALYASIYPGSTAAQIKSAILTSVVLTPSLTGKTVTGGRLNVSGF